jgi:hypothetical protein
VLGSTAFHLTHTGFNSLNPNHIVIAAATENYRSRASPERLSIVHEGTARKAEWLYDHCVDHEIYACLKWNWHSSTLPSCSTTRKGFGVDDIHRSHVFPGCATSEADGSH